MSWPGGWRKGERDQDHGSRSMHILPRVSGKERGDRGSSDFCSKQNIFSIFTELLQNAKPRTSHQEVNSIYQYIKCIQSHHLA